MMKARNSISPLLAAFLAISPGAAYSANLAAGAHAGRGGYCAPISPAWKKAMTKFTASRSLQGAAAAKLGGILPALRTLNIHNAGQE